MKETRIERGLEQWLKILSIALISFVAFETVAVATAMPYVVDFLDGQHLYALASGIPLVTQLMMTALAGPWCDAHGPKPSLYTGLALFAGGLVIATAAPTIEILVVGRAIQGLGGGLVVVPLYVFVGHHVEPARQPAMFAAFAVAWVIPSLIGPTIAGLFVDHVHWRFVFGTVPVLLVLTVPLLVSKLRLFPDTARRPVDAGVGRTIVFALITGLAVGGLQVISGFDAGMLRSPLWLFIIVAASAAAVAAASRLLPLGTFRASLGLPATVLTRGIVNGAYIGVEVFLPLMLKEVHGWQPTSAGLVVTAGSVTWALGSSVQGRINRDQARAKIPSLGVTLQLVGTLLTLMAVPTSMPGVIAIAGWLVAGFGTGLVYPALTVLGLSLTPLDKQGMTSAALQIADTLGASLLVAYAGIIFALVAALDNWAFSAVIIAMAVVLGIGVISARRARDAEPNEPSTP